MPTTKTTQKLALSEDLPPTIKEVDRTNLLRELATTKVQTMEAITATLSTTLSSRANLAKEMQVTAQTAASCSFLAL